ncbi:hypothetical protein K474DRAFT_1702624 [Panus rudis PR-1116 ss-1]|nr:hypothetical protein K474DRAFT_1702624 [Panus rudis PR-1116 ss-1]
MPLLSKALDPLLGVFTGVFAYYLYENHPRTAPPDGERLIDLARWKWEKRRREQASHLGNEDEEVDWKALVSTEDSK